MKLLDTTYKLFASGEADAVAAVLQTGDEDGWTYIVKHDPNGGGYAFIEVYDEEDVFVSRY